MNAYHGRGHSYLVCPRLLELDSRHGEHWSAGPNCRRGAQCPAEHEHETTLTDPEGHLVCDFHWLPGCRPPSPDEHPICPCGRGLVWSALDDLYAAEHLDGGVVGNGD